MEDSQFHIKNLYFFFKNPNNVSKCQLEIWYMQPNYFPTRKLSPPFGKRDYALPWLENIIKQHYWSWVKSDKTYSSTSILLMVWLREDQLC